MDWTLQELKTIAASLPAHERAALVDFLLLTLDEPEDDDVLAEWLAVAEERIEEIKAGRVVGIPSDEVLRYLLAPRQ